MNILPKPRPGIVRPNTRTERAPVSVRGMEAIRAFQVVEKALLNTLGWRETTLRNKTQESVWVDPQGGKMLCTSEAIALEKTRQG